MKKAIVVVAAAAGIVVAYAAVAGLAPTKPQPPAQAAAASPAGATRPAGVGANASQGRDKGQAAPAATRPPGAAGKTEAGKGMAALDRAARAEKHLFVFFYGKDDEQTRRGRKVFDAAMKKVARKADSVAIDVFDPSEKKIVGKFRVERAPMPLVLAVAPNGAVTGGFPGRFDEEQLLGAFASQGMQKCLKALQDRKLVFLCLQNGKTTSNGAAMQGVRDFKADARFAQATEIVMLDPTDKKEAEFLGKLRVEPKAKEAITVLMVPPGMIAAKFAGATNKAGLLATIQRACGSGGCGPSGCK